MSLTVEKCIQAWENSLRQMNAKAEIVFIGDSLTYYGSFSTVFPSQCVCNLGLRGDTIQGMTGRVEQIKLLDPAIVFLMACVNDVGNTPLGEYESLFSRFLDVVMSAVPNASLVVQNLLPVNTEGFHVSCNNEQICRYNKTIGTIAGSRGLRYIDLYSLYAIEDQMPLSFTRDGIHLYPSAYVKWYEAIQLIL